MKRRLDPAPARAAGYPSFAAAWRLLLAAPLVLSSVALADVSVPPGPGDHPVNAVHTSAGAKGDAKRPTPPLPGAMPVMWPPKPPDKHEPEPPPKHDPPTTKGRIPRVHPVRNGR